MIPDHVVSLETLRTDVAAGGAQRWLDWRFYGRGQAAASVEPIRTLRAEKGSGMDDFTVITPLVDAFKRDYDRRAADAGIDAALTMPWVFYCGPSPSRSEKSAGMRRLFPDFAEEAD